MPEINSKRNNKKTASPKSKKSKSKSQIIKNKGKKNGLITSQGMKWKSKETSVEETKFTKQQMYMVIGGIVLFFMFLLWAFVDDTPEWQKRAQAQEAERRRNETLAQQQERRDRQAALSSFNFADLVNSTSLSVSLQSMQTGEDDRLMIVAFDDSTREESGGNVYKVRLFKKIDGIAKRIPKHKLFKRYEEEDIPRFVLFDCGSTEDQAAENVCKQIVGQNVPNILIFRPAQQPRTLPTDLKSDKDIITYLYNLMQPAVKYLDELVEAEDFVADDSELHTLLFSKNSDMDAIRVYDQVSDSLRDYGYFGRTRNPTVIESFDLDETQLPALLIWRTFGENPQIFAGNITSPENVRDFIMNNYVPVFGEFNPMTSKRFMKRGLPILWVSYNNKMSEDGLQLLLNSALSIAKRYRGQLTFVQLDTDAQPQIAQNFGLQVKSKNEDGEDDEDRDEDDEDDDDEANGPHVFIMNQIAQIKEIVNMDDIEGTVQKVIDEYLLQLRIQRGDVIPGLGDDDVEMEDDDDEFEEDDDDEDDDEDDEEEEKPKEDASSEEEKPKTDL
eukprot:CAMPEP_0201570744 /NCGR_PEP_ID=MMETSP0190_2-20130828/13118_1 /ASSEMBLY_ACC=CAM_ASM_000263 /TAXON_ID=37353 /ORGANISM="Rosalina sp." /LENGTH=556 /DNA_ID=CAMNT_0047994603 /DNA_START=38 /DNA_END=1708 /DNA_ORIENTATION=-